MSTQPVIFDYSAWVATFPEFTNVNSAQAQMYFDIATLYFANCGWTAAIKIAPTLLNLLTAHIAWLLSPRDASGNPSSTGTQEAPQIVGRISSAGEGSVNVSVELTPSGSPSEAFFAQTKYGYAFWAACAPLRTFQYAARPTRVLNGPFPYGYGNRYGFGRNC
jgi:hypothetical protein